MGNAMFLRRPLTTHMETLLIDCHKRELMNLEPYEAGTSKYAKGLIERGMLATKSYITTQGKWFVCLYVTTLGRTHLNHLV